MAQRDWINIFMGRSSGEIMPSGSKLEAKKANALRLVGIDSFGKWMEIDSSSEFVFQQIPRNFCAGLFRR